MQTMSHFSCAYTWNTIKQQIDKKKRWDGQMENKNNLMKNQHIFLQVDSS